MLDDLVNDVKLAVRSLSRGPGFAAVAVLTLALGIGANTAIFSVVHQTLLRPLPYESPDRIVAMWERSEQGGQGAVADANFRDWQRASRSFEAMAYHSNPDFGRPQTVLGGSEAVRVWATAVSADFFQVFGAAPAMGRPFAREEHQMGGPPVALVSHDFWRSQLGADPDAVGRMLDVMGEQYQVVGVMEPGFRYPGETDVWAPMERFGENSYRTAKNHAAVGLLARGVELQHAQEELDAIGARLADQEGEGARGASIVSLQEELVGELRRPLLLLLGAALLLLLIACSNLASTLLARGTTRQREVAVRAALGAGRARLIKQFLTESLLLSLLGAAAGLALAALVLGGLTSIMPPGLEPMTGVALNGAVLGFTLLVAAVTAALFGLVPALRSSEHSVSAVLRSGDRGSTDAGRQRLWSGLIAAEVALAIVLLVGSGLLVRSFVRVMGQDAGFETSHVLTAEVSLPESRYVGDEAMIAYYAEALPALRGMRGVEEAGLIQHIPLGGTSWYGAFDIEGRGESDVYAAYRVVSPGYFEAMGIPVARGRAFQDADRAETPHVAIINQTLAERQWPGEDPIGQRVGNLANEPMKYRGEGAWMTIVGVVADVRPNSLTGTAEPEVYVNVMQHPDRARTFVFTLRTSVPPGRVASAVRETLLEVDAHVPVSMATMGQRVTQSVADRRFTVLVLGVFAMAALLLAAVGIYGVVSYRVARRTREIGIRLALGASPGSVLRMVQQNTMATVLVGAAIGVVAALAVTRLLASMLWGVSPLDPATFVGVVIVLCGVAWLATLIPARRTLRIDPLLTIRSE